MSASEVIAEIEKLPDAEQKEVFVFLAEKLMRPLQPGSKPYLGQKLTFEEACDTVFRENRELLSRLAK